MLPTDVRTPGPTDAERVRSILHAATSLTATTAAGRHDLLGPQLLTVGATRPDAGPLLRLRAPQDCRIAREAAAPDPDGLPVLLEWTDVAPAAVRARVRGRVRIAGLLGRPVAGPDGVVVMSVAPEGVMLGTAAGHLTVDPHELAGAEPDPLAAHEGALLTHLADDHHDQVAALTRLLDPHTLAGVVRAWPLALDRYGIVLRLERLRSHHDARLTFEEPLLDVDHVGHRIHALLSAARPRARRPRLLPERR